MRLSTIYYDKALEFAQEVYDTNRDEYERRDQGDRDLVIRQIANGKLAEWGAYIYILSTGSWCTAPDMNIYESYNKSYDADLKTKKYNVHVKSISSYNLERYGASWVFQKNDPIVTEPTIRDCVFFIAIGDNKESYEYTTFEVVKRCAATHLQGLYKPLRKKNLDSKVAIYLEDIIDMQ
tara:strand:- start:211 stop:747 length:537 start_codon:yes stop_codon:yes gene_type:complete